MLKDILIIILAFKVITALVVIRKNIRVMRQLQRVAEKLIRQI